MANHKTIASLYFATALMSGLYTVKQTAVVNLACEAKISSKTREAENRYELEFGKMALGAIVTGACLTRGVRRSIWSAVNDGNLTYR